MKKFTILIAAVALVCFAVPAMESAHNPGRQRTATLHCRDQLRKCRSVSRKHPADQVLIIHSHATSSIRRLTSQRTRCSAYPKGNQTQRSCARQRYQHRTAASTIQHASGRLSGGLPSLGRMA